MVRRVLNFYSTMRREMLEDTTRFLSWALKTPEELPRIPCVRVDSGIKFSERFKVAFWSSVLLRMKDIPGPDEQ